MGILGVTGDLDTGLGVEGAWEWLETVWKKMDVEDLETVTTDHSFKDFAEKGGKEMGLYMVKEMGSREVLFYYGKLYTCIRIERII